MIKNASSLSVFLTILILSYCVPIQASTPSHPEYLIMQNIGEYHNGGKGKCGTGAAYLAAVDHFTEDHDDITCRTGYYYMAQDLAINIIVTKHTGTDSDRWLHHEIEDAFQEPDSLGAAYATRNPIREINGNSIWQYGWSYEWLSDLFVINISVPNPASSKQEPLEVVRAYLQKYPSSIPRNFTPDKNHQVQWIKEEMDRRLWLCDKWLIQLQLGEKQQSEVIEAVVKSLDIFLNYREKYYRKFLVLKLEAGEEKQLLYNLQSQQNVPAIKEKIAEYKKWWRDNKSRTIRL